MSARKKLSAGAAHGLRRHLRHENVSARIT